MSDPAQEDFFAAIGRLTVSWALLETAIDANVTIIHQRVGGHEIEPEAPWALARKLKFLKRCFNRIDRLKPMQEMAATTFTNIKVASDFRHDIVHGAVESLPGAQQVYTLSVLSRGDKTPKIRRVEVTVNSILSEDHRARMLTGSALKIAEWLIAEFLTADSNDTTSEIAR